MRTRLVIVFLLPLLGVLLVLGGAYAWNTARSIQQEFYVDRLNDLSYFVTSARQALRSGETQTMLTEIERFHELYGTEITVVDRAGLPITSDGAESVALDASTEEQVGLALMGRRGDTPQTVFPWILDEMVIVEPVFDDGDVIGAVVLSSSVDIPNTAITRYVWWLAGLAAVALAVGIIVVVRLANWVLRPVLRVDQAMEAIERGEIEARISDETGPPELRRMILLFNRMAEEIERVLSRQQQFALDASHELRNPLNALLVRVEYLATGLSAEWHDDIEAVRDEGRRMVRILDTLLAVAKVGNSATAFVRVDLAEVIRQRAEAWQSVAAQSGVTFTLRGEESVPVVTDRVIVEGALDAILDNALKFSPKNTSIELSATNQEDGCVMTVRDCGPGVETEELERLTDRFWRGAGSESKPGSGLGLAIATDLLASIDGRLQVASANGTGLEVTIHLTRGGRDETA